MKSLLHEKLAPQATFIFINKFYFASIIYHFPPLRIESLSLLKIQNTWQLSSGQELLSHLTRVRSGKEPNGYEKSIADNLPSKIHLLKEAARISPS